MAAPLRAAVTPAPDGSVSVPALVEEARARSGLSPDVVPFFLDSLQLLVDSCRRTGRLNATGSRVLRKVALRHLRNQMVLQAHVAAHPEVARRPLEGAIVVTGLPRTGTTLLHNLLALDPDHRVLPFWQALHPLPASAGGPPAEALRAQAERWLDSFDRLVPEFRTIHPSTPDGPEECDALLQNTFASQHFDDMFDAEEYSRWLAVAPLRREYEHFALQLRVLTTASAPGSTWALKSPSHLGHLDALLAAIPGCTVLHCHRSPRQAVGSHASLVHALRRAYSDAASPPAAGRQALARAATAMARALAVRDRAGDQHFVDVSYRALVEDPVPTVGSVYERLGRPLRPAVEKRMREWSDAHPQHRHGVHRYDLAGFGLTGDEVDGALAAYLDRFAPMASA